jgi:hypothetical protein
VSDLRVLYAHWRGFVDLFALVFRFVVAFPSYAETCQTRIVLPNAFDQSFAQANETINTPQTISGRTGERHSTARQDHLVPTKLKPLNYWFKNWLLLHSAHVAA